jgi:hypothetical protein
MLPIHHTHVHSLPIFLELLESARIHHLIKVLDDCEHDCRSTCRDLHHHRFVPSVFEPPEYRPGEPDDATHAPESDMAGFCYSSGFGPKPAYPFADQVSRFVDMYA